MKFKKFRLSKKLKPAGDQPRAIEEILQSIRQSPTDRKAPENSQTYGRNKFTTLLGATGTGKTFTMAHVIANMQLPALVISPNKTLAAQLCNEFRELFPENAVEYFVSYYDYYQPEAYIPASDTYIEKEAQINDEIDRLRHAATQAILTRKDTIIVASVSCIYGLGSPKEYENILLHLQAGEHFERRRLLEHLVSMQYERSGGDLKRGAFRLRGESFEIMPVNEQKIYRVEIGAGRPSASGKGGPAAAGRGGYGPVAPEVIKSITRMSYPDRKIEREQNDLYLFPAKHYVVSPAIKERALKSIKFELNDRLKELENQGKMLEAERLRRRTTYDTEIIDKVGYCNGIENYSRHFDRRALGEPPFTLLDYFAHGFSGREKGAEKNFLVMIDESHITVPQLNAMFNGDRARKDALIEHGFRLPSARDNRPLTFEEFLERTGRIVFTSATPGAFELKNSGAVVQQIIRPTGLLDPEIVVSPAASEIKDAVSRARATAKNGGRVLVTTLTKKMAEDLAEYFEEMPAVQKIKAKFLHSDINTLERVQILTDFRKGVFDVLVGVNLLREGLDLPEVELVCILDADQEGFLRSKTSLLQTIGRAARNAAGKVVLYADKITDSIKSAIEETERRRKIQIAYNKTHDITPETIKKQIRNLLEEFGISIEPRAGLGARAGFKSGAGFKSQRGRSGKKDKAIDLSSDTERNLALELAGDARPLKEIIKEKEKLMLQAAQELQFEFAAVLRDEIKALTAKLAVNKKKQEED